MGSISISGASASAYASRMQPQQAALPADSEKTQQAVPSITDQDDTPSLAEMMRQAREKAEEQKDRFRLPNTTRYGDAPMEAYARLARARSHADVNAVSGYALRRISQLKAAIRQDSDNADRIRAAIGQLQKVVSRARRKKRDLDREKLAKLQQKKAAMNKERRKEQYLRQELNRRKAMRAIREYGYIREAEIDNRLQDHLAATRMELRAQMQSLSGATAVSPETAAQQYALQAAPAGVSASAAPSAGIDVQV